MMCLITGFLHLLKIKRNREKGNNDERDRERGNVLLSFCGV